MRASQYKPRFNLASGQSAYAVVEGKEGRLVELKWGLVPAWAKDEKICCKVINAKAVLGAKDDGVNSGEMTAAS
jgi:putative SOS response-associated peptidase YedK